MNKLKIATRLTSGFVFLVLLIAIIAGVGLWRIQASERAGAYIAELTDNERLIAEWDKNIALNTTRSVAAMAARDADTRERFEGFMAATSQRGAEIQKQIGEKLVTPTGIALFEKALQQRTQYRDARANATRAMDAGDEATARQFFDRDMQKMMDEYVGTVTSLLHYQSELIEQTVQQTQSNNERAKLILAALTVIALITGALLSIAISRSIVRPLNNAVRAAQTVAGRDLTADISVHGRDETAMLLQALRQMTESLRTVVGDVRYGAQEIATASGQILAGNQDLSSRTEEQAASLTETAAAMEQLTATVRQNADNAQQANTLAVSASEVATRGGEIVAQVITTMDSINDSSRKVEDIIGVIDSIAFQTNILALNAAVESARAGEAGRGFAVVAGEVRSLAQRSAQAAREIKELISASVAAASTGNRLVSETGSTMTEIVEAIQRVTDIMGEITAASEEQSAGIGQVNEAVLQMDQTTRQNAALVEEAAAAASSLQEQASSLARLVATFRISDQGAGTAQQKRQPNAAATKAASHTKLPGTASHANANSLRDKKAALPASTASPANAGRTVTAAHKALNPPVKGQFETMGTAGSSTLKVGAFQTSAGVVEEWEEF